MGVIDMALWDLGHCADVPVYQLLGRLPKKKKQRSRPTPAPIEHGVDSGLRRPYHCPVSIEDIKHARLPYCYRILWGTGCPADLPTSSMTSNWFMPLPMLSAMTCADVRPLGTYHTVEEALIVGEGLRNTNYYWFEHPIPEEKG